MTPTSSIFRSTIVGFVSLVLAMGVGRFAFTPLLPMMREDELVSLLDGGLLASVHFLGYWLGAVSAAKIPLAPRNLLRVSLVTIGATTTGMGLGDEFAVWLMLRWICGICSAWTLVLVSNYFVRYVANNGQAECQGWIFSGVGAGIIIVGLGCLALMVIETGSLVGWQIMGTLSLLAVFWVCLNIGSEVPAHRPDVQHQGKNKGPLDWRIIIAYGVMGAGYIIPATYLPVMAREIIQSPFIFGWSWPVFGAAAFGSTLLAAKFHKRISNRRIWAASQIVMATGVVLPIIYPHILTIIAAGICVGGTFMVITMVGMQEAHRVAPPPEVMRHISAMTASFATGQMIGPVFAGYVYDLAQSFDAALIIAAVILTLSALSLMSGQCRKSRNITGI